MALLDQIKGVFQTTDEQGEPKESILKKPSVIITLVGLLLIICLIGIHYLIFNPKIKNLKKLISEKNSFIKEISETKPIIGQLEKQVEELTIERNTTAKLFVSEQEVEELYQLISFSALKNQLLLGNLNRGEEQIIYQDPEKTIVDFTKIFVKFSITGNFSTYMALRKEIAGLDKNVFFEMEKITRNDDGSIEADVELSMVKMPE
tara:strand:- start:161 stop:775 length:615 start_codon:yes stop_codon:yes gene_type:complete